MRAYVLTVYWVQAGEHRHHSQVFDHIDEAVQNYEDWWATLATSSNVERGEVMLMETNKLKQARIHDYKQHAAVVNTTLTDPS